MNLVTRVKNALIKASTSYTSDIRRAYKRALKREEDENAAGAQTNLENEKIARKEKGHSVTILGSPMSSSKSEKKSPHPVAS